MFRMSSETLVVVRGEFSMEDPWTIPRDSEPVRLRRSTDGTAPRLATTVAAYYDDEYLNVVFSSADDHIVATLFDHDDPLYQEDVVELFIAPRDTRLYYEIEVSPLATTLDARIDSPDGVRETMHADFGWECDGLIAGVRKQMEVGTLMQVDTLIRVPFASLGIGVPKNGDSWRANFFRIDRHPAEGDEYSAWRPTMKTPPDFHVPGVFGRLLFRP